MLDEKNKQDEELISLIQNMYISLGEEVFFTQMNTTLYREDLTNDLLKLNTPIYFFYSKKDKLLDIQNLEYLEKYSNNFCFSKLDSTSHMLTLEKEFEVSSAIKDWF